MITHRQIGAALGLLGISRREFASAYGIHPSTFNSYFSGKADIPPKRMQDMQRWLEREGVEFTSGEGVRRREANISFYRGRTAFLAFKDDVFEMARAGYPNISVSNVDEARFAKWGGEENNRQHRARMEALGNVQCRILVKEHDTNFVASGYAEYRWVPEQAFSHIPLYIYGYKTALVSEEDGEPNVFVIDSASVTAFFQKQFNDDWGRAIVPPAAPCA